MEQWYLHIIGPDDVIPYESRKDALIEANALNIAMLERRYSLSETALQIEPFVMAVVRSERP